MEKQELESIEIELVTQGLYKRYGIDFRNYANASLSRRIELFRSRKGYASITHLLGELLYSEELFQEFVKSVSVTTSEMFRDPSVFKYIRESVIPYLKTFPHVNIWHAACANGEEVYSLAILLKEEGIYDRCSIYATDFNDNALESAQKGIFPLKHIQEYTRSYQRSGGKATLADYYHAKYDHVKFNSELMQNVTFSNHNLAVDSVFIEAHFILCRNVMIYFNSTLQNRVLKLFDESLVQGGVLCLGSKETLRFSDVEKSFTPIHEKSKLYRKRESHE